MSLKQILLWAILYIIQYNYSYLMAYLLIIQFIMSSQADILLAKLQNALLDISSETLKAYDNLCNNQTFACSKKSYNECMGFDPTSLCIQNFATPLSCFFPGEQISNSSGTRFPKSTDLNNLNQKMKLFVCESTKLDSVFQNNKKTFLDKIERSYIGTEEGFYRVYPGTVQNNTNGICEKSYDPVDRPWYIGATTGSKNVIIALDFSLNVEEAIKAMKQAAITVLNSLGVYDFVGVLSIEQKFSFLVQQYKLLRATKDNKQKLIGSINSYPILKTKQNINYTQIFKGIYNSLESTTADDYGSKCNFSTNLVLLMTSNPSLLQEDVNEIKTLGFKIFSFNIGADAAFSNQLRELSCATGGIYFNIGQNYTKLKSNSRVYEKIIKKSLKPNKYVVSEPYNDAFTNIRMITISKNIPVYEGQKSRVLCVAGIDVRMSVLQNDTMSEKDVVKQLMTCYPNQKISFNECYVERLRKQLDENSTCNLSPTDCTQQTTLSTLLSGSCPSPLEIKQVQYAFVTNPTNMNTKKSQTNCCGPTTVEVGAIISAPSFVILIVFFIIWRKIINNCRTKNKEKKKLAYAKIDAESNTDQHNMIIGPIQHQQAGSQHNMTQSRNQIQLSQTNIQYKGNGQKK